MENPYLTMSCDKFWRTGVATKAPEALFEDLWRPKFPLTQASKVVTAGSCFAQNVGRWLSGNGYNFTPSTIAPEHTFSFAMGNIYTGALLRQWLEAATGARDISHVYEEKDGRFYDLLRPSVWPDGYESLEALQTGRALAMEEMLREVKEADVFVFTLGLTECWQDVDGIVYPMCPGTLAGTFNEDRHTFRNIGFADYMADMEVIFKLVRGLNTDVNFLLTVSPVPLTATASGKHVLPATVYSKSVLRSCAGTLADTYEYVDYFPSYELISSNPLEQDFFAENRRSVTEEGVAFVMAHLEAGLLGTAESRSAQLGVVGDEAPAPKPKDENEVCEDIFLETMNSAGKDGRPPHYCLIGDSHMGMISKVLTKENVPHIGGMTMMGMSWATGLFHKDDEEFFVPLENSATRKAWRKTLEQLNYYSKSTETRPALITNIGLHTRASIKLFLEWLENNGGTHGIDVNRVVRFFGDVYAPHIGVLQSFAEKGFDFLVMSDPPLQRFYEEGSEIEELVDIYEKVFGQIVTSIGGQFLMVRDWMESDGGIEAHYCSETILEDGTRDWAHGSEAYYDELTAKIRALCPEKKLALAS